MDSMQLNQNPNNYDELNIQENRIKQILSFCYKYFKENTYNIFVSINFLLLCLLTVSMIIQEVVENYVQIWILILISILLVIQMIICIFDDNETNGQNQDIEMGLISSTTISRDLSLNDYQQNLIKLIIIQHYIENQTQLYQINQENQNNDNDPCVICFSQINIGENVRKLQCSHVFHQQCIEKWFYKNAKCPICRQIFYKK